jgi:citrate lyase beta subunit
MANYSDTHLVQCMTDDGVLYFAEALDGQALTMVVDDIIDGQYERPVGVVAFCATLGWARDVSTVAARLASHRAYDRQASINTGTRAFIETHAGLLAARNIAATARG